MNELYLTPCPLFLAFPRKLGGQGNINLRLRQNELNLTLCPLSLAFPRKLGGEGKIYL